MSIAVWLPRPGQCFPPGKPAAQQKSHSYFTRWSDQNQESLNFIEKNLDLPLYKIEISGIIIIVRCASVAQLVEQGTENPRVIGSIPIGGTTSKVLSFIEKSCKQDFRDEYQTFSSSPQNLASQAFAGAPLKRTGGCKDKCTEYAAVAHLVERHLAKVEVASSSLVGRSNMKPSLMQKCKDDGFFAFLFCTELPKTPFCRRTEPSDCKNCAFPLAKRPGMRYSIATV